MNRKWEWDVSQHSSDCGQIDRWRDGFTVSVGNYSTQISTDYIILAFLWRILGYLKYDSEKLTPSGQVTVSFAFYEFLIFRNNAFQKFSFNFLSDQTEFEYFPVRNSIVPEKSTKIETTHELILDPNKLILHSMFH